MRRPPGRPKRGTEPLDRTRIHDTALAIIHEQGTEALTLRRLAERLDVDPMAIYHHVPNKRALLIGAARHALADLTVPTDPTHPWRERIHAFARTYRAKVVAHADLVYHLMTNPDDAGDVAPTATEALYRALEAAGIPEHDIQRSAFVLIDYIHGFALAEAGKSKTGSESCTETGPDFDSYFGFGVDALLRGLTQPRA